MLPCGHYPAEQVPDEFAMRPTLVMRLIKRPRWLLGLLSDFGGYICHAAALVSTWRPRLFGE